MRRHDAKLVRRFEQALAKVLNARQVDIAPYDGAHGWRARALAIEPPGGPCLTAFGRISGEAALATLTNRSPGIVLGFPVDAAPALTGLGPQCGAGAAALFTTGAHALHLPPGADFHFVMISAGVLEAAAGALQGPALRPPQLGQILAFSSCRRTAALCARLCRDHGLAGESDDIGVTTVLVAGHGRARAALNALAGAIAADLAEGSDTRSPKRRHEHETITRHCQMLLSAVTWRRLGLDELTAWTGWSEKKIRAAFQEVVGFAPLQWHQLQRLCQARGALKTASPYAATVSDIATRHGFAHLGRFSDLYVRLYREYPSATLRDGAAA